MPRLYPPKKGATVRMYRTGHGDCFLLAFPGSTLKKPVYVLIDCGYKPGSPAYIKTTIKEIAKDLKEATGGHLDVAIVTHEHQDHVNGITEQHFQGITIGQAWFAWTEDPNDALAETLRRKFKDQLLKLLSVRNRLQVSGDRRQAQKIEEFLLFELGGTDERLDVTQAERTLNAAEPHASTNKQAMKVFKDRAANGIKYLHPHDGVVTVPKAKHARAFVLGPPRDLDRLKDLDPTSKEEFHFKHGSDLETSALGVEAALDGNFHVHDLFAKRYTIALEGAQNDPQFGKFFCDSYGAASTPPSTPPGLEHGDPHEIEGNSSSRRIDSEWLYSAEQLALAMNSQTNNSSLVLAFELEPGGKVLLFAADAQRGNWLSWGDNSWEIGTSTVSAKDLLARTVLYKVGHHGSHNATLNGTPDSTKPNLSWMGTGTHAKEFTAMITAVRAWAETQKGWDHPQKAIKDALLKKAGGRVFQTDTDLSKLKKNDTSSPEDWDAFLSRSKGTRLYFDYTITP